MNTAYFQQVIDLEEDCSQPRRMHKVFYLKVDEAVINSVYLFLWKTPIERQIG